MCVCECVCVFFFVFFWYRACLSCFHSKTNKQHVNLLTHAQAHFQPSFLFQFSQVKIIKYELPEKQIVQRTP